MTIEPGIRDILSRILAEHEEDDTKTRLINAAEELFALHGLEGVSTRQITRHAGQRNESAMHYHFGSRQNLVQAIVDRRALAIDELRKFYLRRLERNGQLGNVRGLCECIGYPQLDLIRETRGRQHYARFVDAILRSQSVAGLEAVWRRHGTAMGRCVQALRRALPQLTDEVFMLRFTHAVSSIISGLASIERACGDATAAGVEHDPDFAAENILDMAAAGFSAPVSERTQRVWDANAALHGRKPTWPPDWVRPATD